MDFLHVTGIGSDKSICRRAFGLSENQELIESPNQAPRTSDSFSQSHWNLLSNSFSVILIIIYPCNALLISSWSGWSTGLNLPSGVHFVLAGGLSTEMIAVTNSRGDFNKGAPGSFYSPHLLYIVYFPSSHPTRDKSIKKDFCCTSSFQLLVPISLRESKAN